MRGGVNVGCALRADGIPRQDIHSLIRRDALMRVTPQIIHGIQLGLKRVERVQFARKMFVGSLARAKAVEGDRGGRRAEAVCN